MPIHLKWSRTRLDPTVRSLLDRAMGDLNRTSGQHVRPIRLPGGKLIVSLIEDLWFCRVGDGGNPPLTWTVVVDSRPPQRTLLPTRVAADFDECCDLLGLRSTEQRGQFHDFLHPDTDRSVPSPAAGAS